MPNTHCLPSGSLGTGEVGVPIVPGNASILTPSGSKRGIAVFCHGMGTTPLALPPVNTGGFLTLANDLKADGWIVLYAIEPGDGYLNGQAAAVNNDLFNDSGGGDGARHQACILHWWDHVVNWINLTYGNWPTVIVGYSWGGMHALSVAIKRTSTIMAYVGHHPVSNPSLLNPSVGGFTWSMLNTTGINVGASGLNALPNGQLGSVPPGLLGWGTIDTIIDYPQSGDLLTPAIYSAANGASQPVSPNCNGTGNSSGGTPEAHVMTAADISIITGWFTSTVDPLAPAVH